MVFDPGRAARYRKTARVLAFRSDDAFTFEKPWGTQRLPPGSFIVIPLRATGPGGDVYGCHVDVFARTYRPCAEPNVFEKHAEVLAYQPGAPFAVRTVIGSFVEVDPELGGERDWIVRNASGEIYAVADTVFRDSYRSVDDDP